MGPLNFVLHVANLLAPAAVVGLGLAVMAPVLVPGARPRHALWRQAGLNFLAGGLASVAGLVYFGHDAKMASYAAMVLACATAQWVAAPGGRR